VAHGSFLCAKLYRVKGTCGHPRNHKRNPSRVDQLEVERLRGLGLSGAEIGRRLGVSRQAIAYWLAPECSRERARCQKRRQRAGRPADAH